MTQKKCDLSAVKNRTMVKRTFLYFVKNVYQIKLLVCFTTCGVLQSCLLWDYTSICNEIFVVWAPPPLNNAL